MQGVFFSGHRRIPPETVASLALELDMLLRELITNGATDFYCGGARGFDALAAQTVFNLKKTYPFLRLHLILPCSDQNRFWDEEESRMYRSMLQQADSVRILYDTYNETCMYERNRALVDAADICVCFLKERQGGTAYTVSLAAKKNKTVLPVGLSQTERARFEEDFLHGQTDIRRFELGL